MFSCVSKEKFEVEIHIVPRMPAAVLAHLFNSDGYCTYWQEYGENFIISGCSVFGPY
jgi:hypothetical protein